MNYQHVFLPDNLSVPRWKFMQIASDSMANLQRIVILQEVLGRVIDICSGEYGAATRQVTVAKRLPSASDSRATTSSLVCSLLTAYLAINIADYCR